MKFYVRVKFLRILRKIDLHVKLSSHKEIHVDVILNFTELLLRK